jgi:hypothetical protein
VIKWEIMANRALERARPVAPLPGTEDITLKRIGGVYVVTVLINQKITLDFIVDSGASDVLIPADVAMTLARAGTIAKGDFIGDQLYQIGDGSTLPNDLSRSLVALDQRFFSARRSDPAMYSSVCASISKSRIT